MAITKIADVIVPTVFNPYVVQRTMELSELFSSGIAQHSAQFDALASVGAKTVNMPFWNDLTGDDEVLSDSNALTAGKITASKDEAVILRRGRAWGANDLAGNLAGDDPMRAIGDLVASYWARRYQAALISTLTGVFSASTMSNLVHDISSEADDAANISAAAFIDATQKLGDAKDRLTAVAMHSAVEAFLAKQDLIEYERDSTGAVRVRRYMGNPVIIDDSMPVSTGVYTTYLFGEGAVAYGNGSPTAFVPTETARDALASEDYLVNRQTFILHPRGVRFKSASVSGAAPSNAELATASNWERVFEEKAMRIVQFKHKIG